MHHKNEISKANVNFAKTCIAVHHFINATKFTGSVLPAEINIDDAIINEAPDNRINMYDHYMEANDCLMEMDSIFYEQVITNSFFARKIRESARVFHLDMSYFIFFRKCVNDADLNNSIEFPAMLCQYTRSKEQLISMRNQLHPSLRDCFMILAAATTHYTLAGLFYNYFIDNGFSSVEMNYLKCVSDTESGHLPFMLDVAVLSLSCYDDNKRLMILSALRTYMYTVLTMHENLSFLSKSRAVKTRNWKRNCFFNKLNGISRLEEVLSLLKASVIQKRS